MIITRFGIQYHVITDEHSVTFFAGTEKLGAITNLQEKQVNGITQIMVKGISFDNAGSPEILKQRILDCIEIAKDEYVTEATS
jgi:hypothetical protein